MILDNYWKWKGALTNTNFICAASTNNEMNVITNMFALNGSAVSMIYRLGDRDDTRNTYFPKVAENFNLKSNMDLQFATADGSISEATYNTPSQISGITKISLSATYVGSSDGGKCTIVYSGTNSNNSSITIERVGIIKKIYHANKYYVVDGEFTSVLIGIVDLAEPVIVPARMSFTLTVEWDEV